MDTPYRPAELSARVSTEIKRLEHQLSQDTGRPIVLVAYEPQAVPTPVFNDIQEQGPAHLKQNVFQGQENLYGNITQWHI